MQESNTLGIEESRPLFSLIGTAVRAVAQIDSNGDGSIEVLEILNAVQLIAIKVLRKVPNINAFRQEAADFSEAEKAELIAILSAETQMVSAKLDTLFDRAAAIVLDVVDFAIDARRPEEDFTSSARV